MSKLHRRGYLAISTIAAVSALLVAVPVGASATEGSAGGSTSGETAGESSGGSTPPAASGTTEWTPQGGEGEASGGESASLVHGSSVGSGAVGEKGDGGAAKGNAGSDGGAPPPAYTPPESSGSYEPSEPSTTSTSNEPVSTPQAEGGAHKAQPAVAQPTATPKASRPVHVAAVGTATSLGRSASSQGDGASSASPAVAAPFVDPGDRTSMSSFALPLLIVIALGLALGFAGVRFKRHRERGRLEAQWREQDAAWEAALRRAEVAQAPEVSVPSAQDLQRIGVG